MGISLNHLQRFMPGQMHHVVQGHTSLYQSRSKGVAEVMKTKVYDPRFLTCRIKRMLEALQGFATLPVCFSLTVISKSFWV